VRVDILERLADLIRPAVAYRPGQTPGAPPPGAADQDGFVTTVSMTSLAGCSGEDFASILRSLGYVSDKRPGPPITVPLLPVAPTVPLVPHVAAPASTDAAASPTDALADEAAAPEPTDAAEPAAADAAAPPRDPAEPVPQVPDEEPPAEPELPLEEPPHPDEDEPPTSPDAEPDPIGDPAEPDVHPLQAERPAAVNEPEEVAAAGQIADETVMPSPDLVDATEPTARPAEADAALPVVGALDAPEPTDTATSSAVVPEASAASEPSGAVSEAASEAAEAPSAAGEAPSANAEAPSEPALIEVWRPQRAGHNGQRRHERGHARPQHPRRGGEHRGNRRPSDAPDAVAATPEAPVRPPEGGRHRRPDGGPGERRHGGDERRHGGEPRFGGHGPRPDGEGKPRFDPRRERHGRSDNRPAPTAANWSSAEPRPARERQPDPNSPFAKLAALKADLEAKTKKD
jgi:ATP-dependent RNA helicase SUPV3L1/SUV3